MSATAAAGGRLLIPLMVLLMAGGSVRGGRAAETDESTWHDGADGFARGLEEALADQKPLAVYFYADWCGYCRQFEAELLYVPKVEESLGFLTRVRINPESGAEEGVIAQRYGVDRYPMFVVHPGPGHKAKQVTGRIQRDGQWGFQTPEEFIETLRQIADPD